MNSFGLDEIQDIVVVGVGPPALVALLEAKRAGLSAVGIDKGPVCSALLKHPTFMKWFSTADKLELAGFPLLTEEKSPTRREYLKYCRAFQRYHGLLVNTYREVAAIEPEDGGFRLPARDRFGREYVWRARNVIIGTGFYDSPRKLHVRGEDLPHVTHFYTEPHGYVGHNVVVIGGGSSAAEAALDLWREGATVSVVMRDAKFHTKFWVEPDIENRIKEGSIPCHRHARVLEITPDDVVFIDREGEVKHLPADFVLAMTGFEPDTSLLKAAGAEVDVNSNKPLLNDHLESTVPGLYVMGTLIAGVESNVVFIENSRDHGPRIVQHILNRRRAASRSTV